MKRIDKHIALESGNPVKVIKPQKSDTHIALEDDGSGDGSGSSGESGGRGSRRNGESTTQSKPITTSSTSESNNNSIESTSTQNTSDLMNEFAEIYKSTYDSDYNFEQDKYADVSISTSSVTIDELDVLIENLISGGTCTSVGAYAAFEGAVGIPLLIINLLMLVFGSAISATILGAGTYPTYTIVKTKYVPQLVEVANYHGYRIYEERLFKYTDIVTYYILNGKIAASTHLYTDEYLAYRYRNHP